jgi:hypothetical protein
MQWAHMASIAAFLDFLPLVNRAKKRLTGLSFLSEADFHALGRPDSEMLSELVSWTFKGLIIGVLFITLLPSLRQQRNQ